MAGLISRISEMIVLRKWRKLHPAVGLPTDAPEYLETENGSFIRPCPENEWIPFAAEIRSVAYMTPIVGLGGMCMAAGFAYLAKNFPAYEGMLFGAMLATLGLTVSSLFIVVMRFDRSLKKAPGLLLDRPSRMFDPGDASFAAGVDPSGGRKKQFLIPDEVAVVRAIPGYLEFEMSRAQLRVAAEDMKVHLGSSPSSWETGLVVRCDFGDLEWSVVVGKFQFLPKAAQPKPRLFQGLRGEQPAQSLARYLQRSMGIPEQDITYTPEIERLPRVPLPLVIPKEERRSRQRILLIVLCGTVLGAVPTALATLSVLEILSSPEGSALPLWVGAVFCGSVSIWWWWTVLREIWKRRRDTWTLADDGITYEPPDQPSVHIRWEDVERVRWSRRVQLIGRRDSVVLNLDCRNMAKARQVIQRKLGSEFDLSTRCPIHSRVFGAVWTVLYLASGLLAALGAAAAIRLWFERYKEMDIRQTFVLLLIVGVFASPFILLTLWLRRRMKRLNPEWREREKGTDGRVPGPESELRRVGEEG